MTLSKVMTIWEKLFLTSFAIVGFTGLILTYTCYDSIVNIFGVKAWVLGYLYLFVLLYFACFSSIRKHALVIVFTVYSILFYLNSWFYHFYNPEGLYLGRTFRALMSWDYEWGLIYLIVCTLVVFYAISLSDSIFKVKWKTQSDLEQVSPVKSFNLILLFLVLAIITQLYLRYYGNAGEAFTSRNLEELVVGGDRLYKLLVTGAMILSEPEVLFLVFASFVAWNYKLDNTFKLTSMIAPILIVCVATVLLGSRAGIYQIAIICLCVFVGFEFYRFRDYKVPKKFYVFLLALVIFLPSFFYVATTLRSFIYEDGGFSRLDKARWEQKAKSSFLKQSPLSSMLRRLSSWDSFILIVSKNQFIEPSEVINWEQTLKVTVDQVAPGTVFGSHWATQRNFGFIYNNDKLRGAQFASHGYTFGFFGISHIMFGAFGALFFIFIFVFMFGVLWHFFGVCRMGGFYRSILLLMFYRSMDNFGFDYMVASNFYFVHIWFVLTCGFYYYYYLRAKNDNPSLNASELQQAG